MAKINGIKVYDHLMSIKNNLDNEHAELLGQISKINNIINRAETTIDKNLKLISDIRIQEFNKDYTSLISNEELEAFNLVNKKREEAINNIDAENVKLKAEKEKAEKALNAEQEELNKLNTQISDLKNKLEAIYNQDVNLSNLIKQHKQSLNVIEQYNGKIEELNSQKRNVISFENDEAFNYLYKRHFGKPEYNRNFITSFFDKKLATSIGYMLKLNQYESLVNMPKFYSDKIQAIQHEISTVEPIINEKINKIEKDSGFADLVKQKNNLKTKINNILDSLKSISSRIHANIQNLEDFDKNQDHLYKKATSILNNYINDMSIEELESYVNSTTNKKDNILFNEIQLAHKEIKSQQFKITQLNVEKDIIVKKVKNTDDVISKMKRENLNSKKVTYDNSVLNDMTLNNVLYTHLWWTTLNNDYSREVDRPSSYDSYGSSGSSSSSWGSSSSSSSSSWSSSSSFDSSSSFSTSDSF